MVARRTIRSTAAVLAAATMALSSAGVVQAAQKAVAGKNTCTVTALAPTLTKTSLTGSATVICTLSTAVTIEFGVVELDGTVEDTKVPVAVTSKSIAVTANKAMTINTATVTCLNTETGNEEYATKARVNISGVVSAFDRTVPKTDAYAC